MLKVSVTPGHTVNVWSTVFCVALFVFEAVYGGRVSPSCVYAVVRVVMVTMMVNG